ncbi:hypothetical protein QTP88_012121 [Uroleucon formosanum]
MVDEFVNYPMVLTLDNVVSDSSVVSPLPMLEVLFPAESNVLTRDDTAGISTQRRYSSMMSVPMLFGPVDPKPEQDTGSSTCVDGTRQAATVGHAVKSSTLRSQTKRFVRHMFCCGI